MALLSLTSGPSKSFTGIDRPIPVTLKFPQDSVIPYYGSDPGLGDWTRYSAADGYCLYSATTDSAIGLTTAQSNGGAIAYASSSDGSHTGTMVSQNVISTTGGGTAYSSGGVSHSHSVSGGAYYTGNTLINKQNITLLRANKPTRFLPPDSLVIKQTAASNSVAFTASSSTYLVGANNDISLSAGVPANAFAGISVSSDSGHYHASSSSAYRTYATGAYFRNYDMTYAGAHTHSGSISFTQSTITSKLVNLWKLTNAIVPETDIIVMYAGSLANLPSTWKLCDGTNGTTNLGGYIIGYGNNQWNVVTTSNAAGALSLGSAYVAHSHAASYARTANVAGPSAYHSNYGWTHGHNGFYYLYSYSPPRIGVAFIQYKG